MCTLAAFRAIGCERAPYARSAAVVAQLRARRLYTILARAALRSSRSTHEPPVRVVNKHEQMTQLIAMNDEYDTASCTSDDKRVRPSR